ncbi:MAG: hypothetical protein QME44_09260 [Thermodesulfobacteriota bacterium]|nr:hypothetical protein [Thermodesulfobacteriota bacterium]
MEADKKADLVKIIDKSTEDLHSRIDMQRHILTAVIEKKIKKAEICPDCVFADCPHKKKMKAVLTETVAVLEQTKTAFKSKRLEVLRKRLVEVLTENS